MSPRRRVLVVGLDGATWDLLDPWLSRGALPTLGRLIARGSACRLQSTLPPVTSPAWPSFMTGKEPANHGVFDFFRVAAFRAGARPGRVELVDSTDIRSRLFWECLSAAGRSVGVLNVPVTYPPRPVNGYLVPGLPVPDDGIATYPPQVLQPYANELGPYRTMPRLLYEPGNEAEFGDDLRDLTATQIAYALRLCRAHPTDFMMVHFPATDVAQHKLWRHLDAAHPWHVPARARFGDIVRELYVQIDAGLNALLTAMPDAAVFVLSDHGFGPQTRTVNLNLHLAEHGLLTFEAGRRLRRWAWRREWSTKVGQRLWRRERLLDWDDVDWTRTRAYALGHMGQIWLNVPDRERATARTEVARALRELKDPVTGGSLVDRLIWREEAPGGAYAHEGPEAYVIMDGHRAPAYPMLAGDGRVVTEQRRGDSGHHRPDGILVGSGEGIRAGATLEGARLVDVAPTILHLMGVAVPDDLDGRVLRGLLEGSREVEYQPSPAFEAAPRERDEDLEARMAARLRALGYLEGSTGVADRGSGSRPSGS